MSDASGGADERPFEQIFYPSDQIRLLSWQALAGPKSAVVLMGAVTLLSFVTGLSTLSQPALTPVGPLTAVMPFPTLFIRFAGVLIAFPLGVCTLGLQRRRRIAWIVSIGLLPLLAVLPLTAGRTTDIPLLLMIAVTIPVILRNHDSFNTPLGLSSFQTASVAAIGGVGLYGTIGSYGLRTQFVGLQNWGDAIYYTIVTIATVGYGDVTPTTVQAKMFSLSVIVLGTGAFTVAVGALIAPAIESRMAAAFGNMTASELALLSDHLVILGYGAIAESYLNTVDPDSDIVIITDDSNAAAELSTDGREVITEDPTQETAVSEAGVDTANTVAVASDDDAQNVLSILAVRNVDPDVRIVAVANNETHVAKMRSVGADEVINLRGIGGQLLGKAVSNESHQII